MKLYTFHKILIKGEWIQTEKEMIVFTKVQIYNLI